MSQGVPKYVCFECRTHRRTFTSAVPHCAKCQKPMTKTPTGWNKIPKDNDDAGWHSLQKFSNWQPTSLAELRARSIGRKK